jgi:hypothetical protein
MNQSFWQNLRAAVAPTSEIATPMNARLNRLFSALENRWSAIGFAQRYWPLVLFARYFRRIFAFFRGECSKMANAWRVSIPSSAELPGVVLAGFINDQLFI